MTATGHTATPPTGGERFAWSVTGWSYHPHSSPEYQPEEASGVIVAEGTGEALEVITRGSTSADTETIPWDLFDPGSEITVTIKPAEQQEE